MYFPADSSFDSSSIIERPRNPVLRERVLDAPRKSLCIVDKGNGEILGILRHNVELSESHTRDTEGGKIAHQVQAFVEHVNPTREDSEDSASGADPDWSGTSDDNLPEINLFEIPPVQVTSSTPVKSARARSESMATFTTLATYQTGRESAYITADEAPSRPSSSVSSLATVKPEPNRKTDVLLEFLQGEGSVRLSTIRPRSEPATEEARGSWIWDLLSPDSLWSALSSWFAASHGITKKHPRLDRTSVVYFDEVGDERRVWMKR